jgi:cytidine deaminase
MMIFRRFFADNGKDGRNMAVSDSMARTLMRSAVDHIGLSYAPYSHFHVSAALLADDGTVTCGVNCENASYPAGICAERAAVSAAVSAGKRSFLAIAIVGGKDGKITGLCAPCGICRQVLREFADPDLFEILLGTGVDDIHRYTLAELLPESFGPENLGR